MVTVADLSRRISSGEAFGYYDGWQLSNFYIRRMAKLN